jgi:type I restriction enzyme M protein
LISGIPKSNGRGEQKLPICEPISGSQNAKLSDAQKHDYVLTPGRYVGAEEGEDDDEALLTRCDD